MPRLSKTKEEKQRQALVDAVDLYMLSRIRSGFDSRAAALALGIPYSTLNKRRQNPGQFTLREIQLIANVLNVSVPSLLGERNNAN